MALIVATGFVVDDAIVVLENISRHIERGVPPFRAAVRGVREVGFTVMAMSVSLVAVFIPILLMGDLLGRLFREFAVTLTAAIMVSLLLSLILTPMMCSRLLKPNVRANRQQSGLGLFFQKMEPWFLCQGKQNQADRFPHIQSQIWKYLLQHGATGERL